MISNAPYGVEPWFLTETSLDLNLLAQSESVFALSNGHIGLRGNLDEVKRHEFFPRLCRPLTKKVVKHLFPGRVVYYGGPCHDSVHVEKAGSHRVRQAEHSTPPPGHVPIRKTWACPPAIRGHSWPAPRC